MFIVSYCEMCDGDNGTVRYVCPGCLNDLERAFKYVLKHKKEKAITVSYVNKVIVLFDEAKQQFTLCRNADWKCISFDKTDYDAFLKEEEDYWNEQNVAEEKARLEEEEKRADWIRMCEEEDEKWNRIHAEAVAEAEAVAKIVNRKRARDEEAIDPYDIVTGKTVSGETYEMGAMFLKDLTRKTVRVDWIGYYGNLVEEEFGEDASLEDEFGDEVSVVEEFGDY